MSLFRLVASDLLTDAEVRPYVYDANDPGDNQTAASSAECCVVQLETLDLLNLAPYCLLLAAQEKAQEILARAQEEAAQSRIEATAQGAALGREEAKQELLPSLTAFANAGQTLIIFEEQMIQRYTPQLVRLALEIAEKIIGKAVEEDPLITASVLERAEHEVGESKHMRIFLHPADYIVLAEVARELVRMGGERGRQIEVFSADDIARGGCRLETELGIVDATVPVQLAEIRRQLLDEGAAPQGAGLVPVVKSA